VNIFLRDAERLEKTLEGHQKKKGLGVYSRRLAGRKFTELAAR
jgi:hypothetical protein